VTADKSEDKVTVLGVPDEPGMAAKMFRPLSDAGIIVDMIIQNVSTESRTDMTFTVPRTDVRRAKDLIGTVVDPKTIRADENLAKIAVVGVGMRSHAGVAQKMFDLLARESINILMISTSEIKISVVVEAKYAELAVRVLHDGFGLGKVA
jgi:aspartate kinase